MQSRSASSLIAEDRKALLHPHYHPADRATPLVRVKGQSAVLTNSDGSEYLDGLSCL